MINYLIDWYELEKKREISFAFIWWESFWACNNSWGCRYDIDIILRHPIIPFVVLIEHFLSIFGVFCTGAPKIKTGLG